MSPLVSVLPSAVVFLGPDWQWLAYWTLLSRNQILLASSRPTGGFFFIFLIFFASSFFFPTLLNVEGSQYIVSFDHVK